MPIVIINSEQIKEKNYPFPPKKCRRLKWMVPKLSFCKDQKILKKYENIQAFPTTVGLQLEISNLEQTLGLFFLKVPVQRGSTSEPHFSTKLNFDVIA